MKHKIMSIQNNSNWWAAWISGAGAGLYRFYEFVDFRNTMLNVDWVTVHLINIDMMKVISQIAESVPVIIISGFVGVIAKKVAEDSYQWLKKVIFKTKNNHGTDNKKPD